MNFAAHKNRNFSLPPARSVGRGRGVGANVLNCRYVGYLKVSKTDTGPYYRDVSYKVRNRRLRHAKEGRGVGGKGSAVTVAEG
jgi:hypothetical protein